MNNYIHPTAVVHPNVKMGRNNWIGPYCVINDGVIMGDGNRFEGWCSVGSPAEHKDDKFDPLKFDQEGKVSIGDYNKIREFVTINKPTVQGGITRIYSNCMIMRGGHVSHDTIVHNNVIMSCNVILGGHTEVFEGAYMGIGSATHPKTKIGHYAIVGMGSVVTRNISPMAKAYGSPAKEHGENTIGIQRAKLTDVQMMRFKMDFENLTKEKV